MNPNSVRQYDLCAVATHLHNAPVGKESAVLRITTRINPEVTHLIIEGKIAGACVGELEKCWRETASTKSAGSIWVDLGSVTFVDAAGKELLAGMHKQGARLTAAGLLAKCLIEEIESSDAEENSKNLESVEKG